MAWIAQRMLSGDRGKYLGIILRIAFSSLLITQQASIFCGVMSLTVSPIRDIGEAAICVMDPGVDYLDAPRPLPDNDVFRVREVEGVQWAVRLYRGRTRGRLLDGEFQQMKLVGLDDPYLAGAPDRMLIGRVRDLWQPDAVIMDDREYRLMWPGERMDVRHRSCSKEDRAGSGRGRPDQDGAGAADRARADHGHGAPRGDRAGGIHGRPARPAARRGWRRRGPPRARGHRRARHPAAAAPRARRGHSPRQHRPHASARFRAGRALCRPQKNP